MGRTVVWVALVGTATLLLLISSVAVAGWLVPPAAERAPVPPVPFSSIEEDEPGWDCRTMGNRVCSNGHADTNDLTNLVDPCPAGKSDVQCGA